MKTYQEIYAVLRKKVVKDFGKRCPNYEHNCAICQVHLMLYFLKDCVLLEQDENKGKWKCYENIKER